MASTGKSNHEAYLALLARFEQEEAENASDQFRQEEVGMQPYFD
jgi:hypothetical protein